MPKASALANVWPWMNQEWPRKSLSWRWPLLSPRNRVYHLYKSVAFTGKRPRRPETVWNIGHPEKQDYFFRCSVAHGNFPFSKSRVPFTFRQVNNHDHEHRHPRVRLKIWGFVWGKTCRSKKKTTKMKGIQLKRKIFHWEPLKIFPLGIALAPRKGRRPSRYEIPIRGSKFLQDFYGLTIFCILQEQFFGMSSDCQEPIMHLSLEGMGFCGGLYLPERGGLSLKA